LLAVALEQFGARGFHATSMEDIADASGVTKPVVYQHFSSKRKLYLAILEHVGADLLEAVTAGARGDPSLPVPSPHQEVLGGFRAFFDYVAQRPAAFRLLYGDGSRTDAEFARTIRHVEDQLAERIASFVDVDLDPERRRMTAYAVMGLAEVAGRHWVAGLAPGVPADRGEGQRIASELADLAWAGLRGLPPLNS
jgi:AcrR family transcriptional regulator